MSGRRTYHGYDFRMRLTLCPAHLRDFGPDSLHYSLPLQIPSGYATVQTSSIRWVYSDFLQYNGGCSGRRLYDFRSRRYSSQLQGHV